MFSPLRTSALKALALSTALLSAPSLAGDRTLFDDFTPLPSTVDWSGFYVGILGGVGAGTGTANQTTISLSGGTIGLRGGFDVQFDNAVLGVALSVERSNISGSGPCFNPAFTCEGGAQTLGRLEARLGMASDAALLYVKGGAAYAYGFADADPTYNDYYFGTWGWTIGVGAEVMVADNISILAEYSYVDLFEHTAPAGTVNSTASRIDSTTHVVNAGINYRF